MTMEDKGKGGRRSGGEGSSFERLPIQTAEVLSASDTLRSLHCGDMSHSHVTLTGYCPVLYDSLFNEFTSILTNEDQRDKLPFVILPRFDFAPPSKSCISLHVAVSYRGIFQHFLSTGRPGVGKGLTERRRTQKHTKLAISAFIP
jgi:hypothetical protein